jgi:glutamate synthase domain-containing protein 2
MYPGFAKDAEEEGETAAAMAFKQVAKIEAHHGARYKKLLENVDAIEIKIGQSAKPGMGGHLPGNKVTPEIAKSRGNRFGTQICQGEHLHTHPVCDLSGSEISGRE